MSPGPLYQGRALREPTDWIVVGALVLDFLSMLAGVALLLWLM